MNCTRCQENFDCYRGRDCSTVGPESLEACQHEAVAPSMIAAAGVEAAGYGVLTRIEEVAEFARRMGYRRLGLAFCIGLADEAELLRRYYRKEGFAVPTACCKIGGLSKAELGMDRLHPDWELEATCNPVGQALELERSRCDLHVAVGLCVGHDAVFGARSRAPVTTLVVKDRVLGHNPLAALYTGYGRKRLALGDG
jgi:uncharacterized metal-binding protein